jgi:hypothetical protein
MILVEMLTRSVAVVGCRQLIGRRRIEELFDRCQPIDLHPGDERSSPNPLIRATRTVRIARGTPAIATSAQSEPLTPRRPLTVDVSRTASRRVDDRPFESDDASVVRFENSIYFLYSLTKHFTTVFTPA